MPKRLNDIEVNVKCPYCDHVETIKVGIEQQTYIGSEKPMSVNMSAMVYRSSDAVHICPNLRMVVDHA